jgi:hypothetical protein
LPRLVPTMATVKRLFALSGNQCAFEACSVKLVERDGTLIGELCHIEAAEEDGRRYNRTQTDEDRRSFENLILLCANHHRRVDGSDTHTVRDLREMKRVHEEHFLSEPYVAPERALRTAQTRASDPRGYWRPVEVAAYCLLAATYPDQRMYVSRDAPCVFHLDGGRRRGRELSVYVHPCEHRDEPRVVGVRDAWADDFNYNGGYCVPFEEGIRSALVATDSRREVHALVVRVSQGFRCCYDSDYKSHRVGCDLLDRVSSQVPREDWLRIVPVFCVLDENTSHGLRIIAGEEVHRVWGSMYSESLLGHILDVHERYATASRETHKRL